MRENGVADVVIDVAFGKGMSQMDSAPPGGGYEVGTYQPAIVALDSAGRTLFSWVSVPRASNLGGAVGRPRPWETWKAVSTSLSGDMSLVRYVPPSTLGSKAGIPMPLPLFYALLFANGNFLGPRTFTLDDQGHGDPQQMMAVALGKLCAAGISISALLVSVRQSRVPLAVGFAVYLLYISQKYGNVLRDMLKVGMEDDEATLRQASRL